MDRTLQGEVTQARAMPKSRLISIVGILQVVSDLSNGQLTIPELADALCRTYDGDIMLYDGGGDGLAEPVIGKSVDENSGWLTRCDIVCEIFNYRAWDNPNATCGRTRVCDYMVTKDDALHIAKGLWSFFTDAEFDSDAARLRMEQAQHEVRAPAHVNEQAQARIVELEREVAELRKFIDTDKSIPAWAQHHTRLLDLLPSWIEAAQFGGGWEKQATLVPTMMEKFGITEAEAKAIDAVTRPDNLRKK